MALGKDDLAKLKERVKGLSADEREAFIEALDLKPDASLADVLKSIEVLQGEVKVLKEGRGHPAKSLAERLFG